MTTPVIVGSDARTYPGLCFLRVPGAKSTKNRLHIDLNPDDRDAEVARLLALGAEHVDVGQGRRGDVGGPRRPRGQRVLRAAAAWHADRLARRRSVRV